MKYILFLLLEAGTGVVSVEYVDGRTACLNPDDKRLRSQKM